MYKYAMTGLILLASVLAIVFSIESIVDAQKHQEDQIVAPDELRFIASNFQFDQDVYTVEQGETMTLTLRNEIGRHNILIEGLDIDIDEGDRIEYTFDEPGEYNIICNLACGEGHFDMVATLIVQ